MSALPGGGTACCRRRLLVEKRCPNGFDVLGHCVEDG